MLKPCNEKPWWIVPETSTVSQTVDQVLYIVLSVTDQTVYQGGKDSKVVYYLYIIYKMLTCVKNKKRTMTSQITQTQNE